MRANRCFCVAAMVFSAIARLSAADDAVTTKPPEPSAEAPDTTKLPPDLLPLSGKAKAAFDRGEFAEAEKIYRRILEKAPDNLYTLSNLGVVLFRQGKNRLAEDTFNQAIAIAPDDGFSHCTLGIVYYQQSKYDDAINELTKALAINPKNATAHNYLGISESQKGRPETAEKELKLAISMDPNYADAHFNLAVVLVTCQSPKKGEANEYYQRALKLGSERDSALEQLIGSALKPVASSNPKGNEPAENHEPSPAPKTETDTPPGKTEPIPEQHAPPALPPALLPLGREAKEQFDRGNYLEAEKIYRRILEKAPNNLYILSNLGVVLFRAGKNKEAEDAFKKALKAAPDDAFSHCTLGIVYHQEGKSDDAVNELTKALALDPQNTTAASYLGIIVNERSGGKVFLKIKTERALPHLVRPPQGDFLTPLEKERLQQPKPFFGDHAAPLQ
jgi:Flp pilus assembly protein TadD